MNASRFLSSPDSAGYYHVMSRSTGGQMLFGAREKNVFAKQMRKHAAFCGVEILTWCMMDNHFHILLRVPPKQPLLDRLMAAGRREFWNRLRQLYSRLRVQEIRDQVRRLEREGGTAGARRASEIMEGYTRRMADLSSFVQGLKYAFSVWFNHKHGRRGTLWMERFRSVLLEGEPLVLSKVAAYIDLNPIRAGLVEDPGDYRWSGYGQAVRGRSEARRGLSMVHGHERSEWRTVSRTYRCLLYLEGVEVGDGRGGVARIGVSEEAMRYELAQGGKVGGVKRLAKRVRSFTEGAAIGSRAFLEEVFEANRARFGPRRRKGARKLRGSAWRGSGLFALRDLSS